MCNAQQLSLKFEIFPLTTVCSSIGIVAQKKVLDLLVLNKEHQRGMLFLDDIRAVHVRLLGCLFLDDLRAVHGRLLA